MKENNTLEYRKSVSWLIGFLIIGLLLMLPAWVSYGTDFVIIWIPAWIVGFIICIKAILLFVGSRIVLDEKFVKFSSGVIFKNETDIPYAKINSVDLNNFMGTLSISTSDNSFKKIYSGMKDVIVLRDELNSRIESAGDRTYAHESKFDSVEDKRGINHALPGSKVDIDTLERLASLHERGAITDAEYDAQKHKILL